MDTAMIYAAYGNNLDLSQMSIRCPGAEIYGRAELKDHELVFRGRPNHAVVTVEPQTGSSVPILLWKISQRHEKSLDRYACYPSFYRKKMMDFQMGYQTIPALIYVMALGHRPGYPSWLYFDTLVAKYQECGFDPALLGKAMERSGELIQLEKGVLYGYH